MTAPTGRPRGRPPKLREVTAETPTPPKRRTVVYPDVLTTEEACAYLGGISRYTLAAWREYRGLPCARLGEQTLLFSRRQLLEWLEQQAREGA